MNIKRRLRSNCKKIVFYIDKSDIINIKDLKKGGCTMAALDVAQYVITETLNKGYPVSNLKLQKMLYFVQGVMLVNYGKPAFGDRIEAWQYGPVVPEVYFAYSSYGATPILLNYDRINLNEEERTAANIVIDSFLRTPAFALVNETHKVNSPWYEAYHSSGDNIISNKSVLQYFRDQYVIK